ncbi:unnamed protein product [Durusdinium trenchii]|uniref:Uncharacterized protein n=1 Tax=Durusdinium trenchii TaxID=1381693 RepID=A0ABP0N0X4_9DINO
MPAPAPVSGVHKFQGMLAKYRGKNELNKDELDFLLGVKLSDIPEWAAALQRHSQPQEQGVTTYRQVMSIVLGHEGAWFNFNYSQAAKRSLVKLAGKDFANMYALMSCLLLCGLGLGTVVRTLPTAGGGRPNWFFCKRAVVASMEWALAGLGARPAAVEEDFDEAWFSFGRGSRAVLCLKLVLELVLISEEEAAEEGHPAAEERLAEPSFGA